MKTPEQYQNEDGSYDCDQVILDAFDEDMTKFEAFLNKKQNHMLWGMSAPELPEPYEALYQQVYALELGWMEAHTPKILWTKRPYQPPADPYIDGRW